MDTSLETLLTPDERAACEAVKQAAGRLSAAVYLVGGAVRDWLLGRPIGDLDFVVEGGDAIPFAQAVQQARGGEVQAHPAFRTATWTWRGLDIDIVTSRAETYPRPAQLPDVTPAPLERDLFRRDFTVNAMAVPLDGGPLTLIDPFDGQGDLRRRVLRVLHPRSFVDDPTRILRAARYAARLGCALEPATRAWLDDGLPYLSHLSGERMKYDLELIFDEAAPERALGLLRQWGAFRALGIPVPDDDSLAERHGRIRGWLGGGGWDSNSLGLARPDAARSAGWGALMYNLGQLSASRWIGWMPFTSGLRDALVSLGALSTLSPQALLAPPSRQSDLLSPFSGLALCIGWLFDRDAAKRRAMRAEWFEWRPARPVTTGDDLRARGLPPGPRYSRILAQLRSAWLDGAVASAEEERDLLDRLLAAE